MKSIQQKNHNLYGLNNIFTELTNLFDSGNLPNKIMLSGPKGTGKCTISYHLINYIFSKNEEYNYDLLNNEINKNNRSFKLIENGSHPNFFLIDLLEDKKNIEISQIRKMIEYTTKSSFDNCPKIILIDNVEKLNQNSINALLKIIEEPNTNVYFILIHDSSKKILKTLKSRCIIFKINLSSSESIEITNKILNNNVLDLINTDLLNYYYTPGNYINLINFSETNNIELKDYDLNSFLSYLIDQKHYKTNNFIKYFILTIIELYFLKKINISSNKNIIIRFYSNFIDKNYQTKLFNLDTESLFMDFKTRLLNE
jgi:DNA polymerase-3 subunit delta'